MQWVLSFPTLLTWNASGELINSFIKGLANENYQTSKCLHLFYMISIFIYLSSSFGSFTSVSWFL